jgi:putative YhdH/YhfP family quinone oxidoreductase
MEHRNYEALLVTCNDEGVFTRKLANLSTAGLPHHEVLIRVHFSSLNYKDALSAAGNRGITRKYPHTPGIDAGGIVETSLSPDFKPGDEVIVTGYDLGMNTPGGFGQYIRVPASWVVMKSAGLSLEESMVLGTAGFTAALALFHLQRCGQMPENGPILVTGATGGVGSLAVNLLSINGYEVIAATGKPELTEQLRNWGANQVIDRSAVDDLSGKALLSPKWAGAIDNAGGNTLATILKATSSHGNVCACGNVASPVLNTTVFPFILNGINLLGINSATTPMSLRRMLWDKLATDWKPKILTDIEKICVLNEMEDLIGQMLQGKCIGRNVLKHS